MKVAIRTLWTWVTSINCIHSNANVDGGVPKFPQRCIISRQQWDANEKRPDCFGELYFQVMWEYTKSLDQNSKPGNSLLILNGALLGNSADHVCFLFFPKHTQRCRILYFWGKERKEKKGAYDGEYDGVADEGDGAVSQCTASDDGWTLSRFAEH